MRRLLFVALIAIGCGGSGDAAPATSADANADAMANADANADAMANADANADAMASADANADADLFGAYPSGGYGNAIGDVVANLAWEGYENDLADSIASTKPYVKTDLDALRRKAPKGYAMIHVSEFY